MNLEDLEAKATETDADTVDNDDAVSGVVAPSLPITPPIRGRDGQQTPRTAALASMPSEWREKLIAEAADMGIKADDDLGWLLVASFINAWASAAAAGEAAESVKSNVSKIPDQIYKGSVRGAEEVGSVITSKLNTGLNKAAQTFVDKAELMVQRSIEKIDQAQQKFDAKLSGVIDVRVENGVQVFAKAASDAAQKVVKNVVAQSRFRYFLLFSAVTVGLLLAGGVGCYVMLDEFHYIAPSPILYKNGKANCGTLASGVRVCEVL